MESLKSYSETLVWVLSMACLRSRTSPHGEVCGKLCLHVAASVEPQPTSCDRPGVTFGQQSGQKARYGRGEQEQVGIHFDTCDSLSLFLTAAVFQGQWLSPHFRFPNRIPYSSTSVNSNPETYREEDSGNHFGKAQASTPTLTVSFN